LSAKKKKALSAALSLAKIINKRGAPPKKKKSPSWFAGSTMSKRSFAGPLPRKPMDQKFVLPAKMGRSYETGRPIINGGRVVVVRHKEYLQTLITRNNFDDAKFPYLLNPGLSDNFPWLSQIAMSFEFYRWRRLRFIYRNHCGTDTNATLYTATQHDAKDPPFLEKEQLLDYEGAKSLICYKDHDIDCLINKGTLTKKLLVRTGPVPSDQSIQLYDAGKFTVVTSSAVGGTEAGDLLVEYEVELSVPKLGNLTAGLAIGLGFDSTVSGTPLTNENVFATNFPPSNRPYAAFGNQLKFPSIGAYNFSWASDPGPVDYAGLLNLAAIAGITIVNLAQSQSANLGEKSITTCQLLVVVANSFMTLSRTGFSGSLWNDIIAVSSIPASVFGGLFLLSVANDSFRIADGDIPTVKACLRDDSFNKAIDILERKRLVSDFKKQLTLVPEKKSDSKVGLPPALVRQSRETKRMVELGHKYRDASVSLRSKSVEAGLRKLEKDIEDGSYPSDEEEIVPS